MNDTTYTREQVAGAVSTAHGQLDEVTSTAPADAVTVLTWALLGNGPFTYDQVMTALNEAANALDEVPYEDSDTIWEQDVRNLFVNTVLHQLAHPGASLADAIAAGYARDVDVFPDEPSERDEAVVETVLGWVR